MAYWTALAEAGTAIVFGPVADPNGAWGVGIIAAEDEAHIKTLTANDPAMSGGIGMRYEVLPMPQIIIGQRRQRED